MSSRVDLNVSSDLSPLRRKNRVDSGLLYSIRGAADNVASSVVVLRDELDRPARGSRNAGASGYKNCFGCAGF